MGPLLFCYWQIRTLAIRTGGGESTRSQRSRRPGYWPAGCDGHVLWFVVAGWWLAIGHLSSALACFVSIVGIPFGIQHIKLALIALAPVGMTVVPVRR